MAVLDERVARIEGTHEQVHTRLTTIEKDLRDFRSEMISELRTLRSDFNAALQRLDSRFDRIDNRLDGLHQRLDGKAGTWVVLFWGAGSRPVSVSPPGSSGCGYHRGQQQANHVET